MGPPTFEPLDPPLVNTLSFYQNGGSSVLRLFQRSGAISPSGIFQCQIRDASGALRHIYIGVFASNAGEYTLCSNN